MSASTEPGGLRRGSRVKRPAARYTEPDSTSAPQREATARKRQGQRSTSRAKRARQASSDSEGEGSASSDDDDAEYCVCRRGNDGTPMICCSQCGEWFHFKCVGLTQRKADALSEYVCAACQDKDASKEAQQPADGDYEQPDDADDSADEALESDADAAERDDAPTPPPAADDKDDTYDAAADAPPAKRARPAAARRPAKATAAQQHPVREHVSHTFTALFEPLFTASGREADDAHTYADELEAELFKTYGQDRALQAYKERFRTLLFNLKDKRNVTLHERITSGRLPAADVVHMTNEALANDEIREKTEQAKREALQRAVLKDMEEGPPRKMTHKGEIDIERDDVDPESLPASVHPPAPPTAMEATDDGNGDNDEPTTQHDTAVPVPASPTFQPAHPRPSASPSPPPVSFEGVWGDQPAPAQHKSPSEPADAPDSATLGIETQGEADTFIDSFLGDTDGKLESAAHPTDKAEASHTPPGSPPPDAFVVRAARSAPRTPQAPLVWDGVITMPEYTSAYVHARSLTEPAYEPGAPLWQDLFPTPERTVEGRLPSDTAIAYLDQVRASPRNQLVVLTLEAGGATSNEDTPTLHSSEALDKLVQYFANKKRFGVLMPAPSAQGTLVKDFYLAPLLADEPVPDWLKSIHPPGLGAAWDQTRPAHIMLAVLVLFKSAMSGRTEAAPAAPAAPAPAAASATTPPVSLDVLLKAKPDAIQNLLSTLNAGGSTPPLGGPTPPMPGMSPPVPGMTPPMPGMTPPMGTAPVRPPMPPMPMPSMPPMPPMPPGPPPHATPGTGTNTPMARPMRPWGGVTPPAASPPAPGGYGSSVPPGFGPIEHPFPVGPGGWYGGNPDRVQDRSRRKGRGGR